MRAIFSFLIIFLLNLNFSLAKVKIDSSSLNMIEKGKITEFIGNVRIEAPGLIVTADRAVSNKETQIIQADGNININYSSKTWNIKGWCEKIIIDRKSQNFIMTENVKNIYSSKEINKGTETVIYADKAVIDYSEKQKAVFEGNVKAKRGNVSVFSNTALYLKENEKIEFKGSPKAISFTSETKTEYSGEVIEFFIEDEKIKVNGNAHTIIYLNELKM